ncbi:GNAT family N-acetyltransferase [Arthrobacter sedimenti]|uniref:GNAT family N-acetyltransferase n=1 Tax=Arthrobacter sedimenti TaxID=2694931 RepID=UPI000B3648A1|nr:GNAT family N-acetyltransferase [Arthrobacter sedimenti]OUM40284.1 GNAT family N-acetyltransferase [Arthrobacter agilis]
MTCTIRPADFDDPALEDFLRAHLADMAPHSPKESQHALDMAALRQPGVRLWVAWHGRRIAGTSALAVLEPGHEELKSMRTEPELRGRGIASALLNHVLADARARHVTRISLETGSMEFFAPARALYARHAFDPCPPFGSYKEDPYSSYMTRAVMAA